MVSIYQVMYFCCLASLALHCPLVLSRCYGHHPAQGGGGVLQISIDRFEILDSRFFGGVGKFGKY